MVFVKTFAQVNISLIEHNRLDIGLVQRTYEPELASGSGFAVDPNGSIVTAGTVVSPDLKRAEIYAVNKVFSERYGKNAPWATTCSTSSGFRPAGRPHQRAAPALLPAQHDRQQRRLPVSVSRVVRVFPWVSDQRKFGLLTAEVLSPAQGKTQDVAVLRIGASSMPTSRSASRPATKAFTVLGFSDVPTGKLESQAQLIGHFKYAGGLPFDEDEVLPKLKEGLAAGRAAGRWSPPRPAR